MQPVAEKYDYTSLLVCIPYTRIHKLKVQIEGIEILYLHPVCNTIFPRSFPALDLQGRASFTIECAATLHPVRESCQASASVFSAKCFTTYVVRRGYFFKASVSDLRPGDHCALPIVDIPGRAPKRRKILRVAC